MELPNSEKRSHDSVGYEHPSRHGSARCGGCQHFIPGSPPRCQAVASPIRAEDWCKRFEAKPGAKHEAARKGLSELYG
jgi:hypothetical protein